MPSSNISFGRMLYPFDAKGVMTEGQIEYLDKISTATNTDVMMAHDAQDGTKQAMILLDKKRGVFVKEKGSVGIGEILKRIYNTALIGNVDILAARQIVNYEIKNKTYSGELEKLGKSLLEYLYASLAISGNKISDEREKFDNATFVKISDDYLRINHPEVIKYRQKCEQTRKAVEECCNDNGLEAVQSSCTIYDDTDY